jgi:hypothetical protein
LSNTDRRQAPWHPLLLPWLLEDGSQQRGAFSEGEIISVSPLFFFGYFFFYIFVLWFSCHELNVDDLLAQPT